MLSACLPPPLPTPYPYRATLPAGLKPPVTLLGDSTMAALVWNGSAGTRAQDHIRVNYTLGLEAESCQRLVVRSCRGRFGYVPPTTIQQMQARSGGLGEAIVVMAGYDDVDIASGIDAVMAEANRQGVPNVIWLTYRSNVDYVLPGGTRARNLYTHHNAVLRQRATIYPTLHLADWDGYSALQPQWFASDGIHINPTGTIVLGTFIRAQLDALPVGRCMTAAATGTAVPTLPRYGWLPSMGIVASSPRVAIDTRPQDGDAAKRKLAAGRMLSVAMPAAVPANATKVRMRVFSSGACRTGLIMATSCTQDPRTGPGAAMRASVLISFEVTVKRGPLCVYTTATTDVVAYAVGWDPPPPPAAAPATTASTPAPSGAAQASTTTSSATTTTRPTGTTAAASSTTTTGAGGDLHDRGAHERGADEHAADERCADDGLSVSGCGSRDGRRTGTAVGRPPSPRRCCPR